MAPSGTDRLLVALYGPTSSGKTALSVELALRIEGELGRPVVVVSADSRQVYRHLDIGTSKTTPEEMRGVRHEMIGVAEPVRKYPLEAYTKAARRVIGDAFEAGAVQMVVGGTGVYVQALLDGWQTDRIGAVRRGLQRDFPPSLAPDAYAMLRRLDRAAAARVHPNNYQAVLNALARVMAGNEPTSGPRAGGGTRVVVLGLDPGAKAVERRVAQTYDSQVARGLYDEVRWLDQHYGLSRGGRRRGASHPDEENQVLHTHGYREYFEVAAERGVPVGRLSPAQRAEVRTRVVETIQRHTRRQRSWFKKLPQPRMVRSAAQAYAQLSQREPDRS